MSKKSIQLGDEIEDVVSKTIGIALARAEYLSGAIKWLMQPYTTEDNEMLNPVWVDDAYCRYKGSGVYPSPKPIMGFHAREVGRNGSKKQKQ